MTLLSALCECSIPCSCNSSLIRITVQITILAHILATVAAQMSMGIQILYQDECRMEWHTWCAYGTVHPYDGVRV